MQAPTTEEYQKIEEILEQLDSLGKQPAADNRRQAERVPLRVRLTAYLLSVHDKASLSIYCRNISVSGIGFVARRPFKEQERFAILLRLHNHPAKLVLARVVYAEYVKGSMYQVGAEFLESVSNPGGAAQIPAHWH